MDVSLGQGFYLQTTVLVHVAPLWDLVSGSCLEC